MNPDQFMPYYGAELESAAKGLTRAAKWSYVAALWHYWSHTHCEGLPDDDCYLKGVCDCPDSEWAVTKGYIFGILFRLEGGKWHQKRSREEYKKALKNYLAKVGGAKIARDSASKPDINPDTIPDINPVIGGTSTTTSTTNSTATSTATATSLKEREEALPEIAVPGLQEVINEGAMRNISPEVCTAFYTHYQGNNLWQNQFGRLIDWRLKLRTWKTRKEAAPGGAGELSSAEKTIRSKEYDRLLAELKRIDDCAPRDAMGNYLFSPKQKERKKELVKRKAELRAILNITV